MDHLIIDQAEIVPLRIISHPKGDIRHAIKASESTFHGFGEAYLTTVLPGQTKGWKKHRRMHLNLIVIEGSVTFHVHDESTMCTKTFVIGQSNYSRLHVPPGLWMAFSGCAEISSVVLNVASIEHDPEEAINAELGTFPLGIGG